jgi:hypothetical protein
VTVREFTKTLPVRLSENDTIRVAKELARAQQELERAKQRKKEAAAAAEAQVKFHEAVVSKAAVTLNQGWEDRDVVCRTVHDWDTLSVRTIRMDTLETLDERPMTESERQRPLPMGDPDVPHDEEAASVELVPEPADADDYHAPADEEE